jgi:ElaB/YqjD/DUF883 family membrane-anchored ribosome-binding protein
VNLRRGLSLAETKEIFMTRSPAETLARDVREGAHDVAQAVGRTGRHLASDLDGASRSWVRQIVASVKARPRQALAIGAAAGALLTFVLRRHGRR